MAARESAMREEIAAQLKTKEGAHPDMRKRTLEGKLYLFTR